MVPGREVSSTGLSAHIAATLAYAAGPFSGALVLLAENTSPYVRFHAWQAIVGLGGLAAIVLVVMILAFASLLVSAALFRALMIAAWTGLGVWMVCWAVCLAKAFRRRRWKLPIAGAFAERLAER